MAAILVEHYGGVGIHTVLNLLRAFPGHFKSLVFLSVGVIDSGDSRARTRSSDFGAGPRRCSLVIRSGGRLGVPAPLPVPHGDRGGRGSRRRSVSRSRAEFPRITFFAGKMIFQRERWWHRLLHNETAIAIQKRLQWAGKTMVTLPIRVREGSAASAAVVP